MKISVRKQQGNRPLGLVVAFAVLIAPATAFMSVAQGQVGYTPPQTPEALQNIQSSGNATGTAKSWLSKAKLAIEQREVDLAENYIQIADELYQAGGATEALHYTPEMAKLDLEQLKTTAAQPVAAAGSGYRFQMSDSNPTAAKSAAGFPAPTMAPPTVTAEDLSLIHI